MSHLWSLIRPTPAQTQARRRRRPSPFTSTSTSPRPPWSTHRPPSPAAADTAAEGRSRRGISTVTVPARKDNRAFPEDQEPQPKAFVVVVVVRNAVVVIAVVTVGGDRGGGRFLAFSSRGEVAGAKGSPNVQPETAGNPEEWQWGERGVCDFDSRH